MNLPNDTYTGIIIERGDAEAAKALADLCRKKDKAIEILEALRKTIKGRYINDPWEGLEAFECSECGAALAIVDDPVKEQPNFCFNCGAKFDWKGVYEAIKEGNPDNWILLCNAGQQIKDGEE